MRQITNALGSSKVATLLALGMAGLYAITEFGTHDTMTATAALSDSEISGRAQTERNSLAGIPLPLLRPDDLPYIEQPHHVNVASLADSLDDASFDLADIRAGAPVPRYFVEHIPVGILDLTDVKEKKRLFLSVALPLVLKVNEEITSRRNRLVQIVRARIAGHELSEGDASWLKNTASYYETSPTKTAELLERIQPVPVSLALAQSIEESGWGTSRFAREGNALFGQRVWAQGNGIVPHGRADGQKYEVKTFATLEQSIREYVHNLNSHPAYAEFRDERSRLLIGNDTASGYELADSLLSYSERGEDYVETIRSLMEVNRLTQFDDAELAPEQVVQVFN
ncbi:glucosaminidase domain-containing protein [Sneathiella chinensis]|uniref:Mannosyl-glycoprotein endo-beta-N-acetylglucosamidase-like domain-containing protein n=1 Tax=Sneathiella chinensis TaxID=349750 RepID=A0ABQ5U401_9PROT|nr:glucosaminidase domain-containing protein [Sneathiella chinensis]GLQ05216.1 hypothetical protein GCM10007924_04370 [Sneathiella chinensis]